MRQWRHRALRTDTVTDTIRPDRRSNGRQADGNHHSYTNSGENDTRGERKLNFEQKLPVSETHATRRLDDCVIHAYDSRVSIADQREKRIERQS